MPRILIVEDDSDLAFGLEDDLTLEGYETEVVSEGVDALDRARRGDWDIILLDVMLPGKDGFEICRELRRSGVETPVIFLTAKSHEAEKVMGLELGGDDYVTKPFSPRELRARIKARLRRPGGERPDTLRFGDAELDITRAELRYEGERVDLTPLEYKLLCAFVENRGRVLTRQQLIDLAWGAGTFVTDRAVDQHVVNLRRKTEKDPAEPRHILSVRGTGYRFDV